MLVAKNAFEDGPLPVDPLAREYEIEVNEWLRGCVKEARCLVCGELVLDKKPFIWWRADSDIILCADCAEHTVNGLSRDVAELKGDKQARGKPGDKYDAYFLKQEVDRLQGLIMKHLQKIVELQESIAKQ